MQSSDFINVIFCKNMVWTTNILKLSIQQFCKHYHAKIIFWLQVNYNRVCLAKIKYKALSRSCFNWRSKTLDINIDIQHLEKWKML